ncbi:MAG: right-handed parallel beta-helix repeat-containing protein [Candidatus Hodarchaeales archaeon]
MPKPQTQHEIEGINKPDIRVQQSISSESFSNLVVTFDISHAPTLDHDLVFMLENSLISEGATFNIMYGFDIPGDTNVLLIPSSTAPYSDDDFNMIGDWFYSEGAHLIWVAGDSDYGGYYPTEPNNGILERLGTSLRLSADSVEDPVCNDGLPYRVAAQTPVQDGELNVIFTEGVGSAIFHGPTSVLGYQDGVGVVDLRWDGIEGIEVIMKSSGDAIAINQDGPFTDFDFYSDPLSSTGSYPMIAIQDMSESKYVIASGEVIYSDYKSQYSYVTDSEVWNGGFHEGKQLVDNILSWFGFVVESEFPQPEPQLRVAFDVSHDPTAGHDQTFMLEEALTSVNVEFRWMGDIYELSEDIDVLLIPSLAVPYSVEELQVISDWFAGEGKKLLWTAGDSDYPDYSGFSYSSDANNDILAQVGAYLRISADAVRDYDNHDGEYYRVAVQTPVSDGALNSIFTDGVSSAMFHGPTSVLGYNVIEDEVVDLTQDLPDGVEIIMRTSESTEVIDEDFSDTDYDYYSEYNPVGYSYPMMAIDSHFGNDKYVIASGEPIFTDYKQMYSLFTEKGLVGDPDAWNGGFHDGKILVDNIFNWFGLDPALPRYYGHAPIYIEGDEEFINQEFPGSGKVDDPYRIEGFSFASWVDNLITISGTSAHFYIGDNILDGLYSGFNAIQLFDVKNGTIESNRIKNSVNGIYVWNSQQCFIRFNEIYGNEFGIFLEHTVGRNFCIKNILYGNNEGISIFNDPYPVVDIRCYQDVDVTTRDSIAWQVTFRFESEEIAQAEYELWDVILTVDKEPVEVEYTDIYKVDWDYEKPWRFDINYFSDPLKVGKHEFYSQFFYDKVFSDDRTAHVTVVPFTRNILFQNELFGNNNGIHLQNAENDLLVGNNIMGNGEGIGVYGSSYNLIRWNQIGNSGMKGIMVAHDFGWGTASEFNEIANNTIYDGNEDGIYLEWANNNLVADNVISGNQWAGIYLSNSRENSIFGNEIFDNEFGIHLENVIDSTITSNELHENRHDAIRMWYSDRITFDSNIIYNTGASGFSINTATEIIVINNILFNNQYGMHTYLFDYSLVSGNDFFGNFEEGMLLWECMNNEISDNVFFYQGFTSIGLYYSENNTIFDNLVCGSGFGVLLETSQNNNITHNEIFETDIGIFLNNKAGNNRCKDNILWANNQGICISNDPSSVLELWPDQYIFATDSDSIMWQANWIEWLPEIYPINEVHDYLLQVYLTVDGDPVEVSFSEVYFNGEQWCFDITYLSDPLSVGEHEFASQFVLAGEIIGTPIAYVNVVPTPPVHNIIFRNTLFDNNNGILLQNANDNFVGGNTLTNNNGEGIGVYGSCNNRIVWNHIESSGLKGIMVAHDFGWDITSESNFIANNTIFGGYEDGISLEWVQNNVVADNKISWNNWAGVRLYGTSRNNDILDNSIHNNMGGGIAVDSYSEVHMRFWWDITATEADHISWQVSFRNESESVLQSEYLLTEVVLTVDGNPVGPVWFSEIYFDWDWQQYRFDVDYYSEPLTVGEHEFHVEFFFDDVLQDQWTTTAIVTVEPATDEDYVSHNDIIGNEIFENSWNGINLQRAHYNTFTGNIIHNNYGDGVYGSGSNNILESNDIYGNQGSGINLDAADSNFITYNNIFENDWTGIQLSGTSSENSLVGNSIHHNWWGTGISLDSFSQIEIYFGQDITATEADSISWYDSFRGSEEEVKSRYKDLEVLLTVDGKFVGVWFSEIYFDEGMQEWWFDMGYFSDPLPVGVYEFTIQFILAEYYFR